MHVYFEPTDNGKNYEKMTGDEIRMTVLLRIMWGTMNGKGGQALRQRLKSFPRGWMQFRQAMGLLDAMFKGLEKTINDRQLLQINNTIANGEVSVKLRRAGAYDDDMNVVRADTLGVVVGSAMRAECMLCVKDRAEIKRCRLRKAIDELCPPESYETHTCVYRDLALDHVYPDTEPDKI